MRFLALILIVTLSSRANCLKIGNKLTIKKCKCPSYQILGPEQKICQNETGLFVRLWNPSNSSVDMIDISREKNELVVVTNVTCSEGFTKIKTSKWDYSVDYAGKLNHYSIPPTENYCLEKYKEKGSISQYVEYCVEDPKIPLCCAKQQTFDQTGSCLEQNGKSADAINLWPETFKYEAKNLKCDKTPAFKTVNFTSKSEVGNYINERVVDGTRFCYGVLQSQINTGNFTVKRCKSDALNWKFNKNVTYVPHCCRENYLLDLDEAFGCIPYDGKTFNLSKNFQPRSDEMTVVPKDHSDICFYFDILVPSHRGKYIIESDGSIATFDSPPIPVYKYCLSLIKRNNKIFHSGAMCKRYPLKKMATMSTVFTYISFIFSIFTLVVHLGIRELRNKVIGICFINQQSESLVRLAMKLWLLQINFNNSSACFVIGIVDVITVLALFFWLNVICFDVWSTFRVARLASSGSSGEKRKLIMKYSLYAWGVPFLAGLIVLTVELVLYPDRNYLSINNLCMQINLEYYSIFVTQCIIMLMNVAFFSHLAFILFKSYLETKKMFNQKSTSGSTRRNNMDVETVTLYLKLFLIMGISWLAGFIRAFLYRFSDDNSAYYYFRFIDILLNDLQGLYIFIIFVAKRTTLELIRKNWFPQSLQDRILKLVISMESKTSQVSSNEARSRLGTETTATELEPGTGTTTGTTTGTATGIEEEIEMNQFVNEAFQNDSD